MCRFSMIEFQIGSYILDSGRSLPLLRLHGIQIDACYNEKSKKQPYGSAVEVQLQEPHLSQLCALNNDKTNLFFIHLLVHVQAHLLTETSPSKYQTCHKSSGVHKWSKSSRTDWFVGIRLQVCSCENTGQHQRPSINVCQLNTCRSAQ